MRGRQLRAVSWRVLCIMVTTREALSFVLVCTLPNLNFTTVKHWELERIHCLLARV